VVDGEEGEGGVGEDTAEDGVLKSSTVQRHRQGNIKIPNVIQSQNR